MTDPRLDRVPPVPPRFSLAALLAYVTAVGILLGTVRIAMYEIYPPVIRLPAMLAVLVLFGILVIVLQFWVSSLLDAIFSGPKKP